ncbi:MAG: peptidoglycan-binding domain-containing protein [Polyangiaceae bacterium]
MSLPSPKDLVEFERMTGSSHEFQVHVERLKLRLKLLGFDGKPLVNAACVLEMGGKEQKLQTDGDGFVEFELNRSERRASLKTPSGVFPLRIGQLDPVSEPTGSEQRLIDLDYLDGPLGQSPPSTIEQAVRRFQADQKLDTTGEMDRDTQDKLAEAYGV